MLPAVAVRQFVPRYAGIIDADDEAPVDHAVSTTTNSLSGWRFGASRSTASINLTSIRQHVLQPIRPPHKLPRWLQVLHVREVATSRRDPEIRYRHTWPRGRRYRRDRAGYILQPWRRFCYWPRR